MRKILHFNISQMNDRKLTYKHALRPYLQTLFIAKHVFFKSRMTKLESPINKYPQLNWRCCISNCRGEKKDQLK